MNIFCFLMISVNAIDKLKSSKRILDQKIKYYLVINIKINAIAIYIILSKFNIKIVMQFISYQSIS